MPAKSEKQARLFRLVRGLQKGDVPSTKVSISDCIVFNRLIVSSSIPLFVYVIEKVYDELNYMVQD